MPKYKLFESKSAPHAKKTKTRGIKAVALFLDFDGTLTNTPGGSLVFTPLYEKLTEGTYTKIEKNADISTMIRNMAQTTREEQSIFALRDDAAAFLKHALELIDKGENIRIHILSKNHFAYIKAVLQFSNHFTPKELAKINIIGLEDAGGDKRNVITARIGKMPGDVHAIICDDSEVDCIEMAHGATAIYPKENVSFYIVNPGSFNWKKITRVLDEHLCMAAKPTPKR